MKIFVAGICTVLSVVILTGMGTSAPQEKPKYTIKEVMKMAHVGGNKSLMSKIAAGMAEKKDAEKLLELYSALSKNEPPKGEPKSWKMKTEAMVAVAKNVVAGKEGATEKLQKAANCAGCHSVHKPKKGE